jgi:hygromycin-B 7''-O-kinase
MMLPSISSHRDYTKVYTDDQIWLPAIRVLCQRHGLDIASLQRMGLGSHVAFRSGDKIIKLFSTLWPEDFISERACLKHIHGLPTPKLIAEGELEGWPYIVMNVVPGAPAVKVWNRLDLQQKRGIVTELGQIMATLHTLPPLVLSDNTALDKTASGDVALGGDWNTFVQARLDNAEKHHKAEEPWKSWINQRLEDFSPTPLPAVLLSADITADHLLLSQQGDHWRVTGFIDFGDARMGHPYYEFIAPLAYYTLGTPELAKLLLESYGLVLTAELADELTTWCLLHEFGRLQDFLDACSVGSPQEFHRALWGDT